MWRRVSGFLFFCVMYKGCAEKSMLYADLGTSYEIFVRNVYFRSYVHPVEGGYSGVSARNKHPISGSDAPQVAHMCQLPKTRPSWRSRPVGTPQKERTRPAIQSTVGPNENLQPTVENGHDTPRRTDGGKTYSGDCLRASAHLQEPPHVATLSSRLCGFYVIIARP